MYFLCSNHLYPFYSSPIRKKITEYNTDQLKLSDFHLNTLLTNSKFSFSYMRILRPFIHSTIPTYISNLVRKCSDSSYFVFLENITLTTKFSGEFVRKSLMSYWYLICYWCCSLWLHQFIAVLYSQRERAM